MAFSVTPTSGAAPYFFTADIDNAFLINGVDYVATVRRSGQSGSCPPAGVGTQLDQNFVDSLINGETVSVEDSVPVGDCRAYTLRILRVDGLVEIASSTVHVDNT